ncbi:MAG: hypothetical protein AAF333_13365 [Planctomycetota bacterium]
MARVDLHVQLDLSHEPDDKLVVYIGTGDRLTLAESTPPGGDQIYERAIGDLADDDPAAVLKLSFEVTPPGVERVAVLAIGVAVLDTAGNKSLLFETFELVADHPSGVTPGQVASTDDPNQARLTWTASPQVEGAAS